MRGDLGGGHLARVEPGDAHGSRRGVEKTVEQLGERGLAGAVLADDAHELARVDAHVKVVDGGAAVGIGEVDVGELDHGDGVGRALAGRGHVARRDARGPRERGGCLGGTRDPGGGACGLGALLGSGGGKVGRDEARDQALGLVDVQAGLASGNEAVAGEAVGHAGDARAVHAHGAQLVGVAEDLVRLAGKRQAALRHHQDAPAVLAQQGNLLLDDDDGDAGDLVDLAKGVEHEARAGGVERGGGLVEHQHARRERQDRGDGDLLLLAARERGDLTVAQIGDADGVQGVGHASLDLVVRHAEVLQPEQHLVLDDRCHHLRVDVLQDASHHATDVGERDLAGVVAVHQGLAVQAAREVMRDRAAHDSGEGRLARARRADDADEVADAYREGHVVERTCRPVGIGERDVTKLDYGIGGTHGRCLSCRESEKHRPRRAGASNGMRTTCRGPSRAGSTVPGPRPR